MVGELYVKVTPRTKQAARWCDYFRPQYFQPLAIVRHYSRKGFVVKVFWEKCAIRSTIQRLRSNSFEIRSILETSVVRMIH